MIANTYRDTYISEAHRRILQPYQLNQHIPLSKQAQRALQLYKDAEPRSREPMSPVTKSVTELVAKKHLPGLQNQVLSALQVGDDALTFIRSVLHEIPTVDKDHHLVNHLGYYTGILGAFFAVKTLDGGVVSYQRSTLIGDGEGQRRAGVRVLSGGIGTVGAIAYLIGRVCDTMSSQIAMAAAFEAAQVLFVVGSAIGVGAAALGALRCYRFNERLNEYLNHPKLPYVAKLRGAVQFLKDAVSVTPEEGKGLTEQQKKDLTETKIKYLKRRTSNQSLALITEYADQILQDLDSTKDVARGVKRAERLLHIVQTQNKMKMALYILGGIAALMTLAALLIGTLLTASVLAPALGIAASALYLAVTLYIAMGSKGFGIYNSDFDNMMVY